jgi:hypothetical protein
MTYTQYQATINRHPGLEHYRAVVNPCRTADVVVGGRCLTGCEGDFNMLITTLLDTSRRGWSIIESDGELYVG